MKFLQKFLGKSQNPQSGAHVTSNAELRIHPRYQVSQFDIYQIFDEKGRQIPVQDISYGGLALETKDCPNDWPQASTITVFLSDINLKCKTTITPIHQSQRHIGYAFIHDNTETLTFLRPTLEDLRLGYTLQPIAEAWRKEEYRTKDCHMYRGDGPVDLIFKMDATESKIVELMMTIRQDQKYHELRLSQNRWRTYHSVAEPGVAVRMNETAKLDPGIIRRAVYILVGAYSRFNAPSLELIIRQLLSELHEIYKPASA